MPSKQASGSIAELCRRCKDVNSVLIVRSEPLCQSVIASQCHNTTNGFTSKCFTKYVHTKCIKRLEAFRVNFAAEKQQRRVALALSFGAASTTLLHVLDLHLKTQKHKTGRTGFAIYAILIEDSDQTSSAANTLAQVRLQYPDHQYISLPLHDVLHVLPEDAHLWNLIPRVDGDETALAPQKRLAQLFDMLPSPTACADMLAILRTRLIVEHAKQNECDSILWGDSATRLAEKTFAETAKGRGFSLPWQLADGVSPLGINFHYPLRDLLKKELVSYVNLAEADLASFVQKPLTRITTAPLSSKKATLDDLMVEYFESVEQGFPSIVSNVVRTMSKLEAPANIAADSQCSLCSMPVPNGQFGVHGWGGDQEEQVKSLYMSSSQNICYGCARSNPQVISIKDKH